MRRTLSLALAFIALAIAPTFLLKAIDADDIALPNGTELTVRLTSTLSSKGNEEGDPWLGKVADPIFSAGQEAIPADCKVHGHVTFIKAAGRATGKGEMRLVADTISIPDRGAFTIVALLKNADDSKGSKVKDAEGTIEGPGKSNTTMAKEVGIGAAGGAGVGAILDGGERCSLRRGDWSDGRCGPYGRQKTSRRSAASWNRTDLCSESNVSYKARYPALQQ